MRRFSVVRTTEYINDHKNIENASKIIPKFVIGSFNKMGNTTILKFLQVNQRDHTPENIDIAVIKTIHSSFFRKNLSSLLTCINESGIIMYNIEGCNPKDFDLFLTKSKLNDCFEKTELDGETSSGFITVLKSGADFNLNLSNLKSKLDLLNHYSMNEFNGILNLLKI